VPDAAEVLARVLSLLADGEPARRPGPIQRSGDRPSFAAILLAAVLVEESSLGSAGARQLRSQAHADDVAAVRDAWLSRPSRGRRKAGGHRPGSPVPSHPEPGPGGGTGTVTSEDRRGTASGPASATAEDTGRPGTPPARHSLASGPERAANEATGPGEPADESRGISAGRQGQPLTMYTTTWCGFCKNLKRLLARAGIEVAEVDIERDPVAAEFVKAVNRGNETVPTLLFADGSTMVNPSAAQVQARLAELAEASQAIISGISGVAHDRSEGKITVVGVPDKVGAAAGIFGIIAEAGVNIDMIVQNVSAIATGRTDISFTLPGADGHRMLETLRASQEKIGFRELLYDDRIGKVSLIGARMRSHPGVSAKFFAALAEAGVNIQMITTSEIRISVVVSQNDVDIAVTATHRAFDLEADEVKAVVHGRAG
jgi:glutaredoxin-like protein